MDYEYGLFQSKLPRLSLLSVQTDGIKYINFEIGIIIFYYLQIFQLFLILCTLLLLQVIGI